MTYMRWVVAIYYFLIFFGALPYLVKRIENRTLHMIFKILLIIVNLALLFFFVLGLVYGGIISVDFN